MNKQNPEEDKKQNSTPIQRWRRHCDASKIAGLRIVRVLEHIARQFKFTEKAMSNYITDKISLQTIVYKLFTEVRFNWTRNTLGFH